MAINNFKPFALDPNANVTSQADWEALPALLSGFTAGKASSAQVNKAIRQASFIAAALAQYTANKSGLDVLDDGDLNGFISKMGTAFGKDFQALDATLSALAGLATGANKLPYFTGNDTAAQTDLTSVGRDIIGKATAADVVSYLGVGTGRLLNVQTFTSTGIYTPTPGTKSVIVEAVGGGGGGGGCAANTTSQASGGEGGGAGAYAISKFTSGFSGVTVNIGIGGVAGTAGGSPTPGNPNWGGDGGATTFGGLLSVSGGKGGKAGGSSVLVSIGSSPTDNSGTVTGANIYYRYGEPGEVAILARSNDNNGSISGRGGSSKFGYPGGRISIQGPGKSAQGHGAGGGGGLSVSAGSAQAGGAGADGMVIVWEYA
ncbi:hypothetical protein [Escherichia coli]|uniref:glycine-rich domain-containing protein n=1 Tax=Escherichia coli TaxID=562 RepID=UPI00208DD39F|nr:hypothetical protein [Escherichia coli]